MKLTFLSADVPLVKSFKLNNGVLEKSPYPNAFYFTSHTEEVGDLKQFHKALTAHAEQGHCLLKGEILRELNAESRAGSTGAESGTSWVCLDIDGLRSVRTPSEFMALIGLGDVSYIVQYSASMGIDGTGDGLRCHIFIQLSSVVAAPFLKQWLISLNLTLETLKSEIALTRTGAALRWPLDITTCQNDKLIYIAPPALGKGIKDSFKGKRVELVTRTHDVLPTTRIIADINKNRTMQKELLQTLRKAAGYAAIKDSQYKTINNVSYLAKPGEAVITGIKTERGFTYFNLNGGDSWGYYHAENNPEFILNFKGEPIYRTEELLPDYWKSLKQVQTDSGGGGREYFAIRDFKTDRLYNGFYDSETDDVVIAKAQNEGRLRSFLKQHGQPVPDFVPDWNLLYDPQSEVKYDPENKVINLYTPSALSKAPRKKITRIPPTIQRILDSAVGTGPIQAHFLNWLACIVQFRQQNKTAWVLHGDQGTGKGILFHKVITPLLGIHNVHSMLAKQLNSQFNGWIETSLLVFVDEVQISALTEGSDVNATLKNYIAEPMVPIRRMYSEVYKAFIYVNFIFASNQPDPVIIEKTDRRNNVGMFQSKRLEMTDEEIAKLAVEVQDFYWYMLDYPADRELAQTVLDTADRQLLMSINRTSVDEVSDALLAGNLEWLLDQLPNSTDPIFNTPAAAAYNSLMKQFLTHGEEWKTITRDELFIIFDYCVGNVPRSPNKFTSMLKHHRLYTKKIRREDTTPMGIDVKWKHDAAWFEEHRAHHCPTTPSGKVTSITKAKVKTA